MTRLLQPSRIVFGLCIAFFGLQYLRAGSFPEGLPPAPPWTPGAPALAYLLGVLLLVAGIGILTVSRAALFTLLTALLFLLSVVLLHTPHLRAILASGVDRTRAFEPLAISGAAFVLASRLRFDLRAPKAATTLLARSDIFGRAIFALSMLVFGEQHFQYVVYIAPLIPAWIPLHVSLVYLTGVCFLAAALAIGFNFLRPLAAGLLGLMFLLWFLIVHLPRVVHAPHNSDEWNSAVIALILAAGSFAIASPPHASHLQP